MKAPLPTAIIAGLLSVTLCPAGAWDNLTNGLVAQFDRFDVVALGEWHGSTQDAKIRVRLIRHPAFPIKVRYVVFECGNSLHQRVLDEFLRGHEVSRDELRKMWRDFAAPGGCDSPVYENFFEEVRLMNKGLPDRFKLRALAAEPPIDWGAVGNRQQWREIAARRDAFAADLITREVLRKGQKALVVCAPGAYGRRIK